MSTDKLPLLRGHCPGHCLREIKEGKDCDHNQCAYADQPLPPTKMIKTPLVRMSPQDTAVKRRFKPWM